MEKKTLRLVTSGILIGLSAVLSFISIFKLPYGGEITLFSMLPIMCLSYMYGIRWGVLCGCIYGVVQALLGASMSSAFAGITGISVVLMVLLDYIFAFAVLGFAGIFKRKIKNQTLAFALGGALAGFLRFICHFLSGLILWGSYAEWFFGAENMNNDFGNSMLQNFSGTALSAIYSLIYNGSYMLPEIVITVFAIVVVMNVKPIKKQLCGA